MLRAAILVGTVLLVGCPSRQPETPRAVDDRPLRIKIAHAEAKRGAGIAELVQLATSADVHARELALRGLGRIGGPQAIATLEGALADREPRVVAAAMAGIGLAASLDENPDQPRTWKPGPLIVKAMPAGWPKAPVTLAGIEALGRAGSVEDQPALAACLVPHKDPEVLAACALALGRHGRRKLVWSADVRAALIVATISADPNVRYAVTYALSREHEPPAIDPAPNVELEAEFKALVEKQDIVGLTALAKRVDDVAKAELAGQVLAARVEDELAEVRAVAVAGLAKRKAIAARRFRKPIEDSLKDRDWRVAVEAVRALAGSNGDDEGREKVSESLRRRWPELKNTAAEAHVVIEALRTLIAHPPTDESAIAHARSPIIDLRRKAEGEQPIARIVLNWIGCLSVAASPRKGSSQLHTVASCTGGFKFTKTEVTEVSPDLQDHLRLPLLAELFDDNQSDVAFRRGALRLLLAHDDPRVRAAGIGALPKTWKDGDDKERATIVGTITSAIAAKNAIVAGTAIDTAPALYDALGADHPLKATLDAALVARAKTETDIELVAALYALIGKRAIVAGADACRAGLTGHPVRARAAAECLRGLGEAVPVPAIGPAEPPPGDVADVIGKSVTWKLVTSRGEIVIELRPDVAPWAVTTIVGLTRRGFYDGIEFHRVVPNFVVQGGDPTMSGWGGPGFMGPSEPASASDGPGFVAGGVGIADAGRDSGGSQWFIMHSRAAHLDGRYTWIGSVVSGQKSADALLIGDRVEKATVEVR